MWMTQFIVLCNMELICRPDPRSRLLEVDLHNNQSRGVTRAVVQADALEQIQVFFGKGLPLQLVEAQIAWQIDSKISLCGNRPTCVLEFFLVDIDRNVSSHEVFQAACMVQVEMSNYNGLDVLDVVASGLDRCRELLFFRVHSTREDISQRRRPSLD